MGCRGEALTACNPEGIAYMRFRPRFGPSGLPHRWERTGLAPLAIRPQNPRCQFPGTCQLVDLDHKLANTAFLRYVTDRPLLKLKMTLRLEISLERKRARAEKAKAKAAEAAAALLLAEKAARRRQQMSDARSRRRIVSAETRSGDAHRKIRAGGLVIATGLGDLATAGDDADRSTALLAGLLLRAAEDRQEMTPDDLRRLEERGLAFLALRAAANAARKKKQ